MNVFVIMVVFVVARRTCCIIHHAVYIDNFVDQAIIQQTVQYPVNRYPITQTVQFVLNSRLRQRHV